MRRQKHIFSLALCILVFIKGAIAQQEYQFANTVNNPYLLNPAAGGMTDVIQIEASARMQWLGYDNGPKTMLLAGNSQIGLGKNGKALGEFNVRDDKFFSGPAISTAKNKHVVGGKIWNDAIGPFSKMAIQGSYAYHLRFSNKLNLGLGIGLGYSNFKLDESKVVLYQQDDASYQQFLGNASQQNMADAQGGLVLYGEKLFIGISGTQLLKNKVHLNQILTGSNFSRHYFFIAKYKIIQKGDIAVEPNILVKITENSPISMDLGARLLYKNSTWFGAQFRTNSNLIFQIGTNLIKNIYISYAFEQSLGKMRTAGNGTHELQIGYYLGKNRNIDKELKENTDKSGNKEL